MEVVICKTFSFINLGSPADSRTERDIFSHIFAVNIFCNTNALTMTAVSERNLRKNKVL